MSDSFFADPQEHERALSRVEELEAQVADEILAGERQAEINVELMRQIDQVCSSCQKIIKEAMRDGG